MHIPTRLCWSSESSLMQQNVRLSTTLWNQGIQPSNMCLLLCYIRWFRDSMNKINNTEGLAKKNTPINTVAINLTVVWFRYKMNNCWSLRGSVWQLPYLTLYEATQDRMTVNNWHPLWRTFPMWKVSQMQNVVNVPCYGDLGAGHM